MSDLQPIESRQKLTVRDRIGGVLAPVAASLVPGSLIGALYLTTGSHWEVMKAALASRGIAPQVTALAAPVVGIVAVAACRYLWRLANPRDDEPSP